MSRAPRIESAPFGFFIIDGKRHENDVVISWNGDVRSRPSSREFTYAEMNDLLMSEPDAVVVGTGHSGMLKVAHDAEVTARLKGVELVAKPTAQAIAEYGKFIRLGKRVIAVLHSTG